MGKGGVVKIKFVVWLLGQQGPSKITTILRKLGGEKSPRGKEKKGGKVPKSQSTDWKELVVLSGTDKLKNNRGK